jgi:hypothetical protein
MSEQRNGLSPDKLQAVNLSAGPGPNRSNPEDCESEAVPVARCRSRPASTRMSAFMRKGHGNGDS